MAKFTFNEKQLIDSVFGMEEGFLLDFTNREFEEFMKDVVSYNIYGKYPQLSKAKMFRKFLEDETEAFAGKAIILLLNYMKDHGLITDDNRDNVDRLNELGARLLGKNNIQIKTGQNTSEKHDHVEIDYDELAKALMKIDEIQGAQARGYAFEKYLNRLFNAFDLVPHASYRTRFDQIDGSFMLSGDTVLLEAKYRKDLIPKDDLILFSNKVGSKSHFTKGLFITYSSVDEKAIDYFTDKSARIVILTVEEIFLLCQNRFSLPELLQLKFRFLNERGIIFRHIQTL